MADQALREVQVADGTTNPKPRPPPEVARKWAREMVQESLAALPALAAHLEEFYVDIPVESADGSIWQSGTKVVRPRLVHESGVTTTNDDRPRPLVIYFYGGGFVSGDPDQVTLPARDWAEAFNATVVLPTYRYRPEVLWPVPMMDGASVTKTIASGWAPSSHQPYFGANPADGFILGGLSAGAVVSSVTAGLASFSDDPEYQLDVPLTGMFLSVPWFFRDETLPEEYRSLWTAREDNANVEGLKTADMDFVYDGIQVTDHKSPLVTPAAFFLGGKQPVKNTWPATYFQACQYDPLRDDAIIFEKMLAKLGVSTKIHVFPDDYHNGVCLMLRNPRSTNPTLEEDTLNGMRWLLENHQ